MVQLNKHLTHNVQTQPYIACLDYKFRYFPFKTAIQEKCDY